MPETNAPQDSKRLLDFQSNIAFTRENWEAIRRHGIYQLSWMEYSQLIDTLSSEKNSTSPVQAAINELKKKFDITPNEPLNSSARPLEGSLSKGGEQSVTSQPKSDPVMDAEFKSKLKQLQLTHLLKAWDKLYRIGMSGRIYNPQWDFSKITSDNSLAMHSTSTVAPLTVRQLSLLLLTEVPAITRERIGRSLKDSGEAERKTGITDRPKPRIVEHFMLTHIPGEGFDHSINAPIFQINMHASKRLIVKDLEAFIDKWKTEHKLGSIKKHIDKIDGYFSVWDEREGFVDGKYHMENARKFKEISARRKLPLPTICSHYCSAFRLIVGKPFSPELWWETFGQLKFRSLLDQGVQSSRNNARHNFKKPTRRPVPVSKLVLSQDSNDALPHLDSRNNDIASKVDQFLESAFRIDLEGLIKNGLTNVAIAKEMDCSEEVVAAFREQHEELLSISAKSGRKKG